jgi:iron-sulfur cluster assembly protein
MAILLTESAANRVKTHLAQRGIGVGLRVGIKKTGCSGFAYVVNYADQINPEDAVFEARGVKVVVDPQSLPLIDGTLVDFVKQGLNEAFKFQNPKAKGECGCGESFNVYFRRCAPNLTGSKRPRPTSARCASIRSRGRFFQVIQ